MEAENFFIYYQKYILMSIRIQKKPQYNPFEQFIEDIIGNERYGLTNRFFRLKKTFQHAESALLKRITATTTSFNSESDATKSSMMLDPDMQADMDPEITTLRSAYFITVHAQLEISWEEIQTFLKTPKKKPGRSLSYEFKTDNPILEEAVNKNRKIFDYNYLRNSFAHQKTAGPYWNSIISKIESGELDNLNVNESGSEVNIEIDNLFFVDGYADIIITFLNDILKASLTQRPATV